MSSGFTANRSRNACIAFLRRGSIGRRRTHDGCLACSARYSAALPGPSKRWITRRLHGAAQPLRLRRYPPGRLQAKHPWLNTTAERHLAQPTLPPLNLDPSVSLILRHRNQNANASAVLLGENQGACSQASKRCQRPARAITGRRQEAQGNRAWSDTEDLQPSPCRPRRSTRVQRQPQPPGLPTCEPTHGRARVSCARFQHWLPNTGGPTMLGSPPLRSLLARKLSPVQDRCVEERPRQKSN